MLFSIENYEFLAINSVPRPACGLQDLLDELLQRDAPALRLPEEELRSRVDAAFAAEMLACQQSADTSEEDGLLSRAVVTQAIKAQIDEVLRIFAKEGEIGVFMSAVPMLRDARLAPNISDLQIAYGQVVKQAYPERCFVL
jgi:predicted nucleotide-binding protein (sugar kinase/HSP70/actin superfamily)